MGKGKGVAAGTETDQDYNERAIDYLAGRIALARAACDKAGGFGLNTGASIGSLVLALEVSDLCVELQEQRALAPKGACSCG